MKLIALGQSREWKELTFLTCIFDGGRMADAAIPTAKLGEEKARLSTLMGKEDAGWVVEEKGEYKGQMQYKVTSYPGQPARGGGGGGGKFGGGGWKPKDPESLKFEQRCMNRRTSIMQSVEIGKMFPPSAEMDPVVYLDKVILPMARKIDLYCEVTLTIPAEPKKQPDDLTTPRGATSETRSGQNTQEFGSTEPVTAEISEVITGKGKTGKTYYRVRTPIGDFVTWSETLAAKANLLVGKNALIAWKLNAQNPAFKDLVEVTGAGGEIAEEEIPF